MLSAPSEDYWITEINAVNNYINSSSTRGKAVSFNDNCKVKVDTLLQMKKNGYLNIKCMIINFSHLGKDGYLCCLCMTTFQGDKYVVANKDQVKILNYTGEEDLSIFNAPQNHKLSESQSQTLKYIQMFSKNQISIMNKLNFNDSLIKVYWDSTYVCYNTIVLGMPLSLPAENQRTTHITLNAKAELNYKEIGELFSNHDSNLSKIENFYKEVNMYSYTLNYDHCDIKYLITNTSVEIKLTLYFNIVPSEWQPF